MLSIGNKVEEVIRLDNVFDVWALGRLKICHFLDKID